MKKLTIIVTIVCVFIASCGRPQRSTAGMTNTAISPLSSTFTIPPTLSPINTSNPTLTITEISSANEQISDSATKTPTPDKSCQELIINVFSTLSGVEGTIPLLSSSYKFDDSFLLNLETGQQISIPDGQSESFFMGATSPDGKWFAYLPNSKIEDQTLHVLNAQGILQKEIILSSIQKPTNDIVLIKWIDNKNIILVWPGEDSEGFIWPNLSNTVILNPFNVTWHEYGSNYPDIFTMYPDYTSDWGKYYYSLSIYNSPLDRVLYLSYDGAVIWDLKDQSQIKLIPGDPHNSSTQPEWSPEGDQFAIVLDTDTGHNIFLISKDGKEKQITFMDHFEDRDFYGLSWSPDGKQLAFWLYFMWDDQAEFAVYNLSLVNILTQEIKTYCLKAYNWQSFSPKWYPIWSPDGKYLVVVSANKLDVSKPEAILIDLVNEDVYKLTDEMIPLGWLINQ